jgi:Peptidase M15
MISMAEYFTRDGVDLSTTECTSVSQKQHAQILLTKVNKLLAAYDAHLGHHWVAIVRSGFRTPAINACIKGAAPNSFHMSGYAIDIADNKNELDDWLSTPVGLAAQKAAVLYREHHTQTDTWCHLQAIPPRSGNWEFFK